MQERKAPESVEKEERVAGTQERGLFYAPGTRPGTLQSSLSVGLDHPVR